MANFKCYQCKYAAISFKRLKRHIKHLHDSSFDFGSEKQRNTFKCKKCEFVTPTEGRLAVHMRITHENKMENKEDINKKPEEDIRCTLCSFQTSNNYMMKSHFKDIHEREVESNEENAPMIEFYIIEDYTYIKTGEGASKVLAVKCISSPCQGMAELDIETMKVLKFPSAHTCALTITTVEVMISDEEHTSL